MTFNRRHDINYQQNPYTYNYNYNAQFKPYYRQNMAPTQTPQEQRIQSIKRQLQVAKENKEIYETLLGFTSFIVWSVVINCCICGLDTN